MKVLVTGAGRSGTNWVTEILRESSILNFTNSVEDRDLFNKTILPTNYSTKLCTEHPDVTIENLTRLLDTYTDMHLIFVIRHPVNNCMSKIARGRARSNGGDTQVEIEAKDASVITSINAVKYSVDLLTKLIEKYPSRVTSVTLESLILNTKTEVIKLCEFLTVTFEEGMLTAYKNNRNIYQNKRYCSGIDTKQLSLHTDWKTVYDGLFSDRVNDLNIIRKSLLEYSSRFGYTCDKFF